MKNNWPETVDELIEECENLIGRDLYTLGERGEPFAGEDEPRVDGTDYLAGEYQYGVMMIPAQWVTNVISSNAVGTGTCHDVAGMDDVFECSECGGRYQAWAIKRWARFCPDCGARIVKVMDE